MSELKARPSSDEAGSPSPIKVPDWNRWRREVREFCASLEAQLSSTEKSAKPSMKGEAAILGEVKSDTCTAPSLIHGDRLAVLRERLTKRMLDCQESAPADAVSDTNSSKATS